MADLIKKRRQSADSRLSELQDRLESAESQLLDRACVYVTGSFGRREASGHSDLDLFIAGRTRHDERALPPLDEILVKADLIKVTRDMGFQDFSGDGEYLVHYSVDKLIHSLGTPEDDAANTFTARLLLLLESRPLLGADVYSDVLSAVVSAYWRDYDDHKNEFLPAFLVNDILRLWRTFCVNYEARTQTEPAPKKAKTKAQELQAQTQSSAHLLLCTCLLARRVRQSKHGRSSRRRKDGTSHADRAIGIIVSEPRSGAHRD